MYRRSALIALSVWRGQCATRAPGANDVLHRVESFDACPRGIGYVPAWKLAVSTQLL